MAGRREFLHIHCIAKRQMALSTTMGETDIDNPSYLQSHRQAHGTAGFSGASDLILRARQWSFSLKKAVGTEVRRKNETVGLPWDERRCENQSFKAAHCVQAVIFLDRPEVFLSDRIQSGNQNSRQVHPVWQCQALTAHQAGHTDKCTRRCSSLLSCHVSWSVDPWGSLSHPALLHVPVRDPVSKTKVDSAWRTKLD